VPLYIFNRGVHVLTRGFRERVGHRPALRLALKRQPDDLRVYTGCERAIRRAIKKARKHHHGHHGPGHYKPHRKTAAIRAA
jgi:hypothetical protein